MRDLYLIAARRVCCGFLALVICQMQAFGSFHFWVISEIYSTADGSVQFIEMSCDSSSQNFIGNHRLITRENGVIKNTFIIPNNVVGNTLNKSLLFATPGFASLPGGITPDFTISNNFLSLFNGTIDFEGADVATYTSLPADGITSLYRTSGGAQSQGVNSPRNFAGQAGSVQPAPRLGIQRVQTNIVISFVSISGRTYGMERTRALTGAWETISTISGDGAPKRVTNSVSGNAAFYRLRQN
jgi:hypothetical protein